jgi:hypothetical protein
MAVLYTQHFVQFFDDNGNPLSGGRLYTYDAGGTTPKATYTDAAGLTANANPVVLDAAGRATVFLDGTTYRFDLKTSGDVLVRSTDNIQSFAVAQANITNSSLALMPANSVKANTTLTSSTPTDLFINADSFLGRASGNITNIPLNSPTNKIINGDFFIWQRGNSVTPALSSVIYSADRFYVYATGAAPTFARVALSGSGILSGCNTAIQITGIAANTASNVGQRIEAANCIDMLAGKTYTLSAWVYCTGAPITPGYDVSTANASDNFTTFTSRVSGVFSTIPVTTWTRISVTFTCTNDFLNGVQVELTFGAVTAGRTIQITGFKVEPGSVATPYVRRQIGEELTLSQRYCYQINEGSTGDYVAIGQIQNSTLAQVTTSFPVPMRGAVTFSGTVGGFNIWANGTQFNISSFSGGAGTANTGRAQCVITGATAGQACHLRGSGGAGRLLFESEL